MQFPAAVNFFALLPRWLNLNRSGCGAHTKVRTSSLNALHNILAKPQRPRTTAHVSDGGTVRVRGGRSGLSHASSWTSVPGGNVSSSCCQR